MDYESLYSTAITALNTQLELTDKLQKRIEKLESDAKINYSVAETIETEVTKINENLKSQLKELEAENQKMKELKCPPIESGDSCICPIEELESILIKKDERIEGLEVENDKFKKALVRIDNWAKAYPLDVFLKPDLKQAAKVLKAAGMTLDAISGDAMRHVIEGVKDITGQALKGGD